MDGHQHEDELAENIHLKEDLDIVDALLPINATTELHVHAVNHEGENLALQLRTQLRHQTEEENGEVLPLVDGLLSQRREIGLPVLPLDAIIVQLFQQYFERLRLSLVENSHIEEIAVALLDHVFQPHRIVQRREFLQSSTELFQVRRFTIPHTDREFVPLRLSLNPNMHKRRSMLRP